ncbi:OpgC domain-containing protein [Breoghania sp.]|uniref:OpgC family protein n=1 Tax=Breoghania sp. TaxID=2065378 RepID=UPI002AA76FF8|nr:OpgC domain-containing protein [Breoghania sp.]
MGVASTSNVGRNAGRDNRIDVLRGMALITIFINHAPATLWASYTMGKFGFSDAAEAFVLMSGIAAGLAYSRGFFAGSVRETSLHIWRRAGVIYLAHVLSIIAVISALMGLAFIWPMQPLIKELHVLPFVQNPAVASGNMLLLSYQLGYFNILPLYCVLLLVLPLLLRIARWRLDVLLWLSGALWLVTHLVGLYFPGWPSGARWFLNPFGWQLLFVIGLMVGIRKKQARALVPYNIWLYGACVLYVAASLWWQLAGHPALPRHAYLPEFVFDLGKPDLALLRLLHILSLAYIVAYTRWIGWALSRPVIMLFGVLGQASLPTFVTGSLLAVFLHMINVVVPYNAFLYTIFLLAGIAIQYAVARHSLTYKKRKAKLLGAAIA